MPHGRTAADDTRCTSSLSAVAMAVDDEWTIAGSALNDEALQRSSAGQKNWTRESAAVIPTKLPQNLRSDPRGPGDRARGLSPSASHAERQLANFRPPLSLADPGPA